MLESADLGRDSRPFDPSSAMPTPEDLARFDVIVVFASIENGDQAIQISGLLDHFLQRRVTVVMLYEVRLGQGLDTIFDRLLRVRHTDINRGLPVRDASRAWEEFFRLFGTSATYFPDVVPSLGQIETAQDGVQPAAFATSKGAGTVYVIPFHAADVSQSCTAILGSLLQAITSDRAEPFSPDYLDDLRLPSETEVLARIDQLEEELADQRAEAAKLYRYRLLLGPLSGDALEELVRDALGVVLERTDYHVQDRPEHFAEDFWISGAASDFALGEVKGIGSGVSRREINQVDNHREELGRDTDELPGLLVLNVFRNDHDLARKVDDPVHLNIIAALRRQNVTLLRTADLYYLLALQFRDGSAGHALITALANGGGWLEVTDERSQLHGS